MGTFKALFPSPFNEDHFISMTIEKYMNPTYKFPSPFNEDHFISY